LASFTQIGKIPVAGAVMVDPVVVQIGTVVPEQRKLQPNGQEEQLTDVVVLAQVYVGVPPETTNDPEF
jgi:hypothetical protein